jgi:hypothetical protein
VPHSEALPLLCTCHPYLGGVERADFIVIHRTKEALPQTDESWLVRNRKGGSCRTPSPVVAGGAALAAESPSSPLLPPRVSGAEASPFPSHRTENLTRLRQVLTLKLGSASPEPYFRAQGDVYLSSGLRCAASIRVGSSLKRV